MFMPTLDIISILLEPFSSQNQGLEIEVSGRACPSNAQSLCFSSQHRGGVAVETFCINLSEAYLYMLFKIGAKPSVYVCVYMSVSR